MEKKECTVEGCDRLQRTKGTPYCQRHYNRWWRNGHPTKRRTQGAQKRAVEVRAVTEKKCRDCGEVKSREHFYVSSKGILNSYCKPCHRLRMDAVRLQEKLNRPPKPPKEPRICEVDDCEREAISRYRGKGDWLCRAHWMQVDRGLEPREIETKQQSYINEDFRRCTACHKVKPQTQFHKRANNKGRQSHCKVCYGKSSRFNVLMREGRTEDALRLAESMPESLREKYVPRALAQLDEGSEGRISQ